MQADRERYNFFLRRSLENITRSLFDAANARDWDSDVWTHLVPSSGPAPPAVLPGQPPIASGLGNVRDSLRGITIVYPDFKITIQDMNTFIHASGLSADVYLDMYSDEYPVGMRRYFVGRFDYKKKSGEKWILEKFDVLQASEMMSVVRSWSER